ncbi:MAG: putative DNA-binding domain-containing protein [Burkholderiaceae bacterium]
MSSSAAAGPLSSFARGLLDARGGTPAGLRTWNGSDPGLRFGVYRNNVHVSLTNVLADTFPVVQRLVGEAFFRAMAGCFIVDCPPASPVMSEYGDGFADWVVAFEPAASVPYLSDMARLERGRVRAFHAADAPVLPTAALAQALNAPHGLPALRIELQPCVTVIDSPYSVVSLWAAHQEDDDDAVSRVAIDRPEAALVLRQQDEILVAPLPPPDAALARCIQRGMPLARAAESCAGADLASVLALLLRHDALCAVSSGEL